MDLFCIDQTEGASISITEQLTAIPAIYKSSRCVKILIESPICTTWQGQASRVVSVGDVDVDFFGEEELRHSRKCPYLLFRDPWFERLWTRQEGLYGLVLDVIILNPVGCRRLQTATKTGGWIAEGAALGKRTVAEFFLDDKLAYHGVPEEPAERMRFQLYLDFVYHHHVDIKKYGGSPGPAQIILRYRKLGGVAESRPKLATTSLLCFRISRATRCLPIHEKYHSMSYWSMRLDKLRFNNVFISLRRYRKGC